MLYHGSSTYIKGYLEPRICFELENYVYATDSFKYALIRSGNFDITKFRVREEHNKEYHELCEIYPGAFKELFDRRGFIYIVDDKDFEPLRDGEYVSRNKVKIVDTIVIFNILDELERYPEINLIKFGHEGDYWSNINGGKEGYLQRKRASVEEVLNARRG